MKFLKLLALPLVFAVVFTIRRMKKTVRLGEIWSPRLGHLLGNTECYLCEKDAGIHAGSTDIWFPVRGRSSHPLIEKKYRQKLNTFPRWVGELIVKVNRLFPGWERHEVGPTQFDRDTRNLWEKHAPHIGFTEAEEKRGIFHLRDLGIQPGSKWVCLIVRDSAYLKKAMPSTDSSYHDYRDSNIANYFKASLELANKGYYVIRMGKIVDKRMSVFHPKIIDYPFHPKASDFGQLYLGAKCEFCFGASTGFMAIPQVFGRPSVVVNFAPIEYISTWCKGLVIWKHHMKDGRRMTLKEIFDSGAGQFMAAGQFKAAGIGLEENSPQEICDAVMEIVNGISDEPQEAFWKQFPLKAVSPFNQQPLHGNAVVRVGKEFLKGYA